jgi:FkbM family methyltransferase
MKNLIFDIGVGSGQDTYYYLKKGFNVVAVEADPIQFSYLSDVFDEEIKTNRLILINAVASNTFDEEVTFYRNNIQQYTSSMFPVNSESVTEFKRKTINYSSLVNMYGVPYYCKIDIERADFNFLPDDTSLLPVYMSVEILNNKDVAAIDKLSLLGYTQFKLVSHYYIQTLYNTYLEDGNFGNLIHEGDIFTGEFPVRLNPNNLLEWSGQFGRELSEEWFSLNDIKKMYNILTNVHSKFPPEVTGGRGVFDCHATGLQR